MAEITIRRLDTKSKQRDAADFMIGVATGKQPARLNREHDMGLKWRKSGNKVWIGTQSFLTYTIEFKQRAAMGERFCLTRGGIASSDCFASGGGLDDMKRAAQEDADRQFKHSRLVAR